MNRPPITPIVLALCCAGGTALGEFQIKQVEVSREAYVEAMAKRPMIFGVGLVWDGRSTVHRMADDFNRVMIERVNEAGVTATRIGFDWAVIEEEPLEYNWQTMDEERGLDRLLAMDIEVIGLINTAPGWATPEGKAGTWAPTEESAELFEAFCKTLAERYRGKIKYYQYGHSMDIDPGWQPKADPVSYARWLKRAYRGLKAGNPDCVVGTGGHLGRNPGFLRTIYEEGGKDFLDAVGVNPWPPYEAPQGDEAFDWKRIEDYRAVMVEQDDADTPIWCSEWGYDVPTVGEENQKEFMARALDYLVHYEFITMSVYWVMADYHRGTAGLFGLCDKDLVPRPAFDVWTERVKPLHEKVDPPGTTEPKITEEQKPE